MTVIPCRRCGEAGGDITRLWKPGPGGALAPYAAQHKAPCAPATTPALVMGTASRPGPCAACTRDIVPGDRTARAGEASVFHYECAPAPDPVPASRPERTRYRRGQSA